MRRVRPRFIVPLLCALLGASVLDSCIGRTHSQREGKFEFRLNELFQDDCGLETGAVSGHTVLWTGQLSLSGDLVRIQLDSGLFNMRLQGRYLNNVERFTVDGTEVDVTGSARGMPCLFKSIGAHSDATTIDEQTFKGTIQVHLQSRIPSCICELSASYTAILQ